MLICLSRCIYLRTCMYVYLCTQQIIFYMFHDACIRFAVIMYPKIIKISTHVILVSALVLVLALVQSSITRITA